MNSLLCLLALVPTVFSAAPPYGQLSVSGSKLKGSNGQNVQLRGMSLFWSQWMGQYYTAGTVQALKCSWNANLVRAAMAVDQGGYLTDPTGQMNLVDTVVKAAIDQGIYVIIDWHAHDNYQSQAVTFFGQMAQKYAGVPNVIYETFNEPLGVSWKDNLVPYHTAVIKAIRQYDTKNVIILGTPTWSQDVDVASQSPITGQSNLMYTLHYYAGTHKADLRSRAQTAINNGLPIFVTEYGTVNADGNGGVDNSSSTEWWNFLNQNSISHANWAVEDKNEGAAVSDSNLTPSGQLVKSVLKAANSGVSCSGGSAPSATTIASVTSKAGATTKAASATTQASSSTSKKLTVAPVINHNWSDGFQVDFVFTNSDTKSVCSAIFTYALKAGQSLVNTWNMEASSSNQYKLPSWVNIGIGASYRDTGISIKGTNSTLPSVSVVSYGYC
uniref:Endoglucanase n=1 Tax=Ditylenchus dipsaci TaxID=166011 RepID=A0A915E9S4_9BILA